ncbi:MAG: tetratricopeptide repeat protein [Sedimentisphaerales bacterium]
MQSMHNRILRKLKIRTWVGFVILLVLAGCATDGKIKPEKVSQEPSLEKDFSVTQLEDGRKGFIITEVSQMDESSRKDFERAVAIMKDQEYEKAVDILEKIIEKSPGVTAPYIDIAIAYQHIDKPERAEENLKAALQLVPDHPVASNEYGLLCRKTGRFDDARAIYEKAITSFPDYYPVHRNLGILCDLYLNDPVCALEHYEIYSEAKPKDKQVKLWIADLRARLGRN